MATTTNEHFIASLVIPMSMALLYLYQTQTGRTMLKTKLSNPSALTDFYLKHWRKSLIKKIRKQLKQTLILHDNQFAYRPCVSTETALAALVEIVQHSLDCKEIAITTFLNIERGHPLTTPYITNRC